MCCGKNVPLAPAMAASVSVPLADVPDAMELLEYTGTDAVFVSDAPSARQYSFKPNDIKYVDGRDVDWFLAQADYRRPVEPTVEETPRQRSRRKRA